MSDPQSGMPLRGPFFPPLWSPHPYLTHHPPFPPNREPPAILGLQNQFLNGGPPPPPQTPPPVNVYSSNPPVFLDSRGSFLPSPALVRPRGKIPHIVSRVVPPGQGPVGEADRGIHASIPRLGFLADSIQHHRSSTDPAGSDRVEFDKQKEGVDVIQRAIMQSQKEKTDDLTELLSQIRILAAEAEETLQKIGKVVMIDPVVQESLLIKCPFDSSHRVPPEALLKHYLSCRSNPAPQVDAKNIMSSIRYPHIKSQELRDDDDIQCPKLERASVRNPNASLLSSEDMSGISFEERRQSAPFATPIKTEEICETSVHVQVDIWGGRFVYQNCPAVVQGHAANPYSSISSQTLLQLPDRVGQLEAKMDKSDADQSFSLWNRIDSIMVKREISRDGLRPLVPSRLWFLLKETETWNELPIRCSSLVLQAATGLGRIQRKTVVEWLLMHGPTHGVVIDPAMASHIYSLVKVCLTDVQKESSALIDLIMDFVIPSASEVHNHSLDKLNHEDRLNQARAGVLPEVKDESTSIGEALPKSSLSSKVTCLDSPRLFKSGDWLASQLSPLFDPIQSKDFVLDLLKHCLCASGRSLTVLIDPMTKKADEVGPQLDKSRVEEVEGVVAGGELGTDEDKTKIGGKLQVADKSVDVSLAGMEVEAAVVAIQERAVLEAYLRNLRIPNKSTKSQLLKEHEAAVNLAAVERSKRVNYRPVSEYDGLISHRSQLVEKSKNKTREELLAEERDYKRRRMSYRGKKIKRNPTQVLHDIIEGYMVEIAEAGGIGCFTKHPGEVPPVREMSKVESSKRSNLSSVADVVNLKGSHDDVSRVSTVTSSSSDLKDKSGGRNDRFRGLPDGRVDWSKDAPSQINVSKDSSKADLQGNKYSRSEGRASHSDDKERSRYRNDGLQGRSRRRDTRDNDDNLEVGRHGKEKSSSHARYWSDHHGRDSKLRRYDSFSEKDCGSHVFDRYVSDYEKDQSYSPRDLERWESSKKHDSFQRHHRSDEQKEKSRSRR